MYLRLSQWEKVENAGYVFILSMANSSYGCKMTATSSSVTSKYDSVSWKNTFFVIIH